jgi:hypothetical protein
MNKAVIGTTEELEELLDLTRKAERERITLILTAYAEQLGPISLSAQAAVEVIIKSIQNW